MAQAFAPNGLQAVRTVTSASFSGQTQTFPIGGLTDNSTYASYAENIFQGDPVLLWEGSLAIPQWGGTGAGASIPDNGGGVGAVLAPVGVFVSTHYVSPQNQMIGISTTPSGTSMYLAGTTPYNDTYIPGQILSDPNIVYTCLVTEMTGNTPGTPLTPIQVVDLANGAGALASVTIPGANWGQGGNAGNTTTGTSAAYINFNQIAFPGDAQDDAFVNQQITVRILGISIQSGLNQPGDPFIFVDCMLYNHLYNQTVLPTNVQAAPAVRVVPAAPVVPSKLAKEAK